MTTTSKNLRLILGLGNPGPDYANTRHNAGIWWVMALLDSLRLSLKFENNFQASLTDAEIHGNTLKIGISNTYMNHSGRVAGSIAKYFDINPSQILIVHDDLDLPSGTVRFKMGGGHGGHNGLRDIIHHLKTGDFQRIRIGIGHPGDRDKDKVADYVLTKPKGKEMDELKTAIQDSLPIVPLLVQGQFEKAMNILHSSKNEVK